MRRSLFALAALALTAPTVRAQQSFFFDNYCSMGAFQVCASVRLFSEGSTLRMQVWNLEGSLGSQHTMTAIGLYHSGAAWTGNVLGMLVTHGTTNITSYWTPGGATDIQTLAGIDAELAEGTGGNAGIIGCTDPGGNNAKWSTCNSFPDGPFVEFNFFLSENFSLDNVELRWHSQQLADGSSVKCDTGGAGDYPPCTPTTVPEPTTMILLGSGLAGIAAVRRRRKQRLDA